MNPFAGIFEFMIILVLGCLIGVGCFVYNVYEHFKGTTIKSVEIIIPHKELIITDNKVDTLYIYKSK